MDRNKVIVVAVAALVAGGAGGYGLAMAADGSDTNNTNASVSTQVEPTAAVASGAADLRVGLNNALREHVYLASAALRSVFDGDADTEAAVAALDENSVAIAAAVDSAYPGTNDDFLQLWRDHIGFFADYTAAAKAGDEAAMQEAKDNLAGYVTTSAAFFADANPENLDAATLEAGLTEHVNQVIAIVDAYGAGDYEESYAKEREAAQHMTMFADGLAGAIVTQKPDQF